MKGKTDRPRIFTSHRLHAHVRWRIAELWKYVPDAGCDYSTILSPVFATTRFNQRL